MSKEDKDITIQYTIKENELESEASRLYAKALDSLSQLSEIKLDYETTTLSHQALDNISNYKDRLTQSLNLFSNVENIVIQYLDYRSSSPQENIIEQPSNINNSVAHNQQNEILKPPSSPQDYQRLLARELGKDEITVKRTD